MRLVQWRRYAYTYDHMAAHNPAYQDLLKAFRAEAERWKPAPESTVLDLGGGTGNFSLECARIHPDCRIVHVDSDEQMNALARAKAQKAGIENVAFQTRTIAGCSFKHGSIAAAISVHTLYALPTPVEVMLDVFRWLRPGGVFFCCDLGRFLDVKDWARFLWGQAVQCHGLWRAVLVFARGYEVAR